MSEPHEPQSDTSWLDVPYDRQPNELTLSQRLAQRLRFNLVSVIRAFEDESLVDDGGVIGALEDLQAGAITEVLAECGIEDRICPNVSSAELDAFLDIHPGLGYDAIRHLRAAFAVAPVPEDIDILRDNL